MHLCGPNVGPQTPRHRADRQTPDRQCEAQSRADQCRLRTLQVLTQQALSTNDGGCFIAAAHIAWRDTPRPACWWKGRVFKTHPTVHRFFGGLKFRQADLNGSRMSILSIQHLEPRNMKLRSDVLDDNAIVQINEIVAFEI